MVLLLAFSAVDVSKDVAGRRNARQACQDLRSRGLTLTIIEAHNGYHVLEAHPYALQDKGFCLTSYRQ